MFKKIAFFALFLAVTGLFAAESVNAQRLVKGSLVKSTETTFEIVPEANPAVVMSQCENGGTVGDPIQDCGALGTDDNWNTGNMNGQKAHYAEGRSIHYRAVFKNLTPGTPYTIIMGYDTLKGSSLIHAIDYLTNYDDAIPLGGTEYDVVPCGSLVNAAGHPCNGGVPQQISIDDDPDVPASIELPAVRNITAWGILPGATLDLSYGTATVDGVPYERLVTITFTPTVSNPVFGWAGHIALGSAWEAYNGGTGAGAINGSPYHMYNRPDALNDFGGAGDLQLATSAITQPSAADAEITGRVTDAYGRAISSAKMTLNNASTGEVEVVYTNSFGYYTFKDVPVGDFFVMTVQHSRYRFVSGSVSFALEDSIAGLDFKASR